MKTWRVIVVGLIQNDAGEYLICKKPVTRGVFPGQWALPGGGIEEGEHMLDALRREIRPLFFKDGEHPKLYPDGTQANVYMIFLNFLCQAAGGEVSLNHEFEAYRWVKKEHLADYDLNLETRDTFKRMGLLR